MSYIGRSPQLGVRTRFYYTATGGETSLSGADDNGATLIFSDGTYVDVLLNGITLVAGVDYNTSTANTISGLAALTSGDVAEIVVYDVFSVGDSVSAANGGTFLGAVAFTSGITTNTADINGGTIDNATIGGTTPAAGTFTTLAATGDTTLDGTAVAKEGMPIVTESGTSKTLALTDIGGYIRTTNGSAVTITVPPNSSVAFPTGTEAVVFQAGAGQVTFAAGSGVTINSKDSNLNLTGQYSSGTLKKVATDEWDLIGDLSA